MAARRRNELTDLCLAVRSHPADGAILANLRQLRTELRCKHVRERHELRGLIRGVAEHVSLVTGTDLLLDTVDVDTLGDIGRLRLDGHDHVAVLVVNAYSGDSKQVAAGMFLWFVPFLASS